MILGCAAITASLVAMPGAGGLIGAALAILMLAIARTDARRFVIPDRLNAMAFGLALLDAWMRPGATFFTGVVPALARGAALALGFLALRVLYRLLRGRQGLGLGDVKLAGVAGAWLEPSLMPICVEIAALAALGALLGRGLLNRRPIRATTALPFGLFLAPSIWVCWLLEATILQAR